MTTDKAHPESSLSERASDAPTKCRRCNADPERKPLVPGKRVCGPCDDSIREDNRRRRAAKHAHEMATMRARGVRPIEEVRAELCAERHRQQLLLIDWAAEHGRVPLLREAAEILGRDLNGMHRIIRSEAFGLKPLARGPHPVIPFPVPAEWRASA